MYRYLANLHSEDNSRSVADQKTRMLLSLIEDLHDCADIMYHSSPTALPVETPLPGEAALQQRLRQWDQQDKTPTSASWDEVLDLNADA